MQPRELTAEDFAATIVPPMRLLVGRGRPDIPLDDYLRACHTVYNPPQADYQFVELHCYVSGDERFLHVVYAYGPPDRCWLLALVLDLTRQTILGHHFLQLSDDGSQGHAAPVPRPNPPPHLTGFDAKELPSA